MNLGIHEILIIALLVIVLFGAKKIPQLFRGMGEGIREFKKATREDQSEKPNG
jgi:sec-independent protein translocase protein TatA